MNSIERVKTLLSGALPDRPPLYDVIRNDAVIEYFSGAKLRRENAKETVIEAHTKALDATKSFFRLPEFQPGSVEINSFGQKVVRQRWTSWVEHRIYASPNAYVTKKSALTEKPWDWGPDDADLLQKNLEEWHNLNEESGDLVMNFGLPGPPRLDDLFTEVGLMAFSYYMADCPAILHRQIEYRFEKIIQAVNRIEPPSCGLIIDETCDMAFKTGLIFSPSFLKTSFIPGYKRLCSAAHRKGWKVLFHSDGNLMEILDDLVEAGIDLLHPVEPMAGMDPGEIHKRYPDLILCGTIDVSELLPFGSPGEIRDQVKKNIEATDGKIMIGSSTEINNEVPLQNYLALHETVVNYSH